jgi:hypothetical protein
MNHSWAWGEIIAGVLAFLTFLATQIFVYLRQKDEFRKIELQRQWDKEDRAEQIKGLHMKVEENTSVTKNIAGAIGADTQPK